LYVCMYVSFGQGSSLLWTHTLRPCTELLFLVKTFAGVRRQWMLTCSRMRDAADRPVKCSVDY